MGGLKPVKIKIISDIVCPWCYIGKKRLEDALSDMPDIPVEILWRPFFLEPDLPSNGITREDFIVAHFGSMDAYRDRAKVVARAAAAEGLELRSDIIQRQPNTLDCHRLVYWAERDPGGNKSGEMKQRLMELFFKEGADLTDHKVLVGAAIQVGLDGDTIGQRLKSDDDVRTIKALARYAPSQGISGVPSYILADKYVVSGAQPASEFVAAIRQVSAEVNGSIDN